MPSSRRIVVAVLILSLGAAACTAHNSREPEVTAIPQLLTGSFIDDYGSRYSISANVWEQLPRTRYRVVRWNIALRYLIAQNDSGNRSAAGRWTRIDWIPLEGMPPYTWAYCYSTYDAPTAAAAESTKVARPDTPRTGCNGYPFSRMATDTSRVNHQTTTTAARPKATLQP